MEEVLREMQIPTFRVKRPHKKTRSGCTVCKRRRVKVGERECTYVVNENDKLTNGW